MRKRYRNVRKSITKNNVKALGIIIILIIGILFIKLGLNTQKEMATNIYEIQKNSDYEVKLKTNDFYMTEILPSGKYYVSESIENLAIDFKYNFKANGNANINYNYKVTAELIGKAETNDGKSEEVWNKIFDLTENSNMQSGMNEFNINQKAIINYQDYNNLVNAFEQVYGINIDALLKVRLNVSLEADYSDMNIETQTLEDYIELDIPINTAVTQVSEMYEKENKSAILINNNETNMKQIVFCIIGGIFIITAISLTLISIRKSLKGKSPEDKYKNNIRKVLKFYKELIVSVINEPNIDGLEVMHVVSLDDMIDVAEQNKINIIHYETKANVKSTLYAITDKYVYTYTITNENLR